MPCFGMADPAEKKKLRQLKEELANRERLLEQEYGKVQKRLQRSIQVHLTLFNWLTLNISQKMMPFGCANKIPT